MVDLNKDKFDYYCNNYLEISYLVDLSPKVYLEISVEKSGLDGSIKDHTWKGSFVFKDNEDFSIDNEDLTYEELKDWMLKISKGLDENISYLFN